MPFVFLCWLSWEQLPIMNPRTVVWVQRCVTLVIFIICRLLWLCQTMRLFKIRAPVIWHYVGHSFCWGVWVSVRESVFSVLARNPLKELGREMSHKTGSGQGKEGPREDRRTQSAEGGCRRGQSAWDSSLQKDTVGRRRQGEDGSRAMKNNNKRPLQRPFHLQRPD